MGITVKIDADIKSAMLNKEKEKLVALRAIKAAILLAKTSKDAADGDVSDEVGIAIIQKLIKQKKETAEIYKEQKREDLVSEELGQAAIFEQYLPAQMSDEDLKNELAALLKEHNITDAKDFGKIMGIASKQLAGKTDNKRISIVLKSLLGS
ncbi:MAG: GatB/YqeY domain-containing protein [Bacteroidota bacterium]